MDSLQINGVWEKFALDACLQMTQGVHSSYYSKGGKTLLRSYSDKYRRMSLGDRKLLRGMRLTIKERRLSLKQSNRVVLKSMPDT